MPVINKVTEIEFENSHIGKTLLKMYVYKSELTNLLMVSKSWYNIANISTFY